MTHVVSSLRTLHELAGARVEKLAQLVLPPGHEPIVEVMVTIWEDGAAAGFQMDEASAPAELPNALYQRLEGAETCSEYDEFPELDDRDFQDLACRRVEQISRGIHPVGHPDVIWDKVEIWTDGVAAALRITRGGAVQQG